MSTKGLAALRAARTPPAAGWFDARAYLAALSPPQQRALGEAMLVTLMTYDSQIQLVPPAARKRWWHAVVAVSERVSGLVPAPAHYPAGPDLAALGIRACRVCGCTDISACRGGCSWVAEELCSSCASPGSANGRGGA